MDNKTTPQKEHKIIIENRKKISVSGVDKVENVNPTQIAVITNGKTLTLLGNNLHVEKLDVVAGLVEISGELDNLKYIDKKQNILKRIFK